MKRRTYNVHSPACLSIGVLLRTMSALDDVSDFISGFYLYIETSGQRFGDRARLGSPNLSGQCTLRMFYHMFGQHVNALVVYMRTTLNGSLTRVANVSGNVGDNWIRQEVKLSNGKQPYQVVIEGQ